MPRFYNFSIGIRFFKHISPVKLSLCAPRPECLPTLVNTQPATMGLGIPFILLITHAKLLDIQIMNKQDP